MTLGGWWGVLRRIVNGEASLPPEMEPDMTTVLTIAALDLGIDSKINYMSRVCNRWAISGGRRQIQVPVSGKLDPSAGDNPRGSIYLGARALNTLIRNTPGPKVVLGYSQGAQVAGTWLRQFAYASNSPSADELSFILIGNPERRLGKQPWTKKTTPDNTKYSVRDVSRRNDNWADYNPAVHSGNKFMAMFGSIHTNYFSTDLYDPQAELRNRTGNTDYIIVP